MISSNGQKAAGTDTEAPASTAGLFQFDRDTFSFPNELVWEYQIDPGTGETKMGRREPPPTYAHHCFVLIRSARQFLFHARFEPAQPGNGADYARLVRKVVGRSPRRPSPEADKIVIPGYASLRTFSRGEERVLKANCGGAWQSYALRSHWRMVFPISRRHQERTAARLLDALARGDAPIVHVVRFPQLTINHGLLLFARGQDKKEIRFLAYDPNIPQNPVVLTYDRAVRTFCFPRTHYWSGGRLDVIHIYRGWFY